MISQKALGLCNLLLNNLFISLGFFICFRFYNPRLEGIFIKNLLLFLGYLKLVSCCCRRLVMFFVVGFRLSFLKFVGLGIECGFYALCLGLKRLL